MKKQFKKALTLNLHTDWFNIDKLKMFAERFGVRHARIYENDIAFITLRGVIDEELFETFIESMDVYGMRVWWDGQITFDV